MKKMNNKGFSLVELIVVVLIMAIIAVALAPQVMKWVENSRKSTDCNNYDSIVSAVNVSIADEKVMKAIGFMKTDAKTNDFHIVWYDGDSVGKTGSVWTYLEAESIGNSTNKFTDVLDPATVEIKDIKNTDDLPKFINFKVQEILGQGWATNTKIKRTADYPDTEKAVDAYRIKITYKGVVERVNEPGQPDSTTAYKDSSAAHS
jgi:prepilin-type N-terminal cleavage/methylation domain-containing protein